MKYRIRKYQIERIALIVLSIESLLILRLYEPTEPIFNFKFKEYFKLVDAVPIRRYTLNDVKPVETKIIIVYGNRSKPCRQLLNSDARKETELLYFPSSLVREYRRIYHFKDIYASTRYSLATKDGIVDLWPELTYLPYLDKPTTGPYGEVVYLATLWPNVFGHLIHDVLSSIVTFPMELINRSYLLTPFNLNISKQYLEILGFPTNKVIQHNGSWVFCQNLYCQVPLEPVNALSIQGITNVSKKIHEKLKLDLIEPTRYVFSNREEGKQRHIHNLIEFFEATKEKYFNYPWELANVNSTNVTVNAKQMASIKFWVVPSGSNVFNIVFMNKNAGVLLIMSEYADYPNFGAAYALDLLMIGFTNDFKHWHTNGGDCDIAIGLRTISKLLSLMKTNEIKYDYNWKLAFDINHLWELVEDQPEEPFSVAKIENFRSTVI